MKTKLKTVEWYDARELTLGKEEFERMINSTGKEYLAIKKTHGIVYELKSAVVIVMEDNNDGECEFTIVPNDWVVSIT